MLQFLVHRFSVKIWPFGSYNYKRTNMKDSFISEGKKTSRLDEHPKSRITLLTTSVSFAAEAGWIAG